MAVAAEPTTRELRARDRAAGPRRSPIRRTTLPLGPVGLGLALRVAEPFGLAVSVCRRHRPDQSGPTE
jgi:hypothetical protein